MRYYEDEDIYSHLNEFSRWRDILEVLQRLAEVLKDIHEKGLIHGNLHGGNILLGCESDTNSYKVKIVDTGLHGAQSQQNYSVISFAAPRS